MRIECLDKLGEVGERAGQPIDFIDDDHIDPSRLYVGEQLRRAGRSIDPPEKPPSS